MGQGRKLIAFLFLLLGTGVLSAQTGTYYKVDEFVTTTAVRTNTSQMYWWKCVNNAGATMSSGSVSGPNVSVNGGNATCTWPAQNKLEQFRVIWGVGVTVGEGARGWQQSYKWQDPDTPQQNGPSGPVNGAGVPVDGNGVPVDNNGIAKPIVGYSKSGTLKNDNPFPMHYKIRKFDANGNQVGPDTPVDLQPGAQLDWSVAAAGPGRVKIFPVIEGREQLPIYDEPFQGITDAPGPNQAQIPAGGSAPNTTTGPKTTTGSVALPGTTPETRPGNTEGNAEARHKELGAKVDRGTEQAKQNGDKAHDDANRINDTLDAIADWLKGDGIQDGGDGEAPGLIGDMTADIASIQASLGKFANLGGSIPGRLGLTGASPTNAPLRWQITLPIVGLREIDLESRISFFQILRNMLLWYATYWWMIRYVEEFRKAFA